MIVGITYNLKSDIENIKPQSLLAEDAFEEFDTEETIDAIAGVLRKNGHSVVKLGWGKGAIKILCDNEVDFVFNLAEGFWGRNRESQMPALLEMLEVPYSGSDPLALSLALDKISSKEILKQNNIRTPDYFVLRKKEDIRALPAALKYPLFVKPAWEGSSKGIRYSSKVFKTEELAQCVDYLFDNCPNQPVLVEQYIPGREFTVGILGNERPQVIGVMEISPKTKGDFFYSIEVKRDWENLVSYDCPAKIENSLRLDLEIAALTAFKAFGARDVARIDFRVSDKPYLIEINPLPGLSPKYSDIVIMARKMGRSYDSLITAIFDNAVKRNNEEIRFCPNMGK